MTDRCPKRDKPYPLPAGMTIEAARAHPGYKSRLEPGAQCEHEEGHDGPHRNGGLVWHDPPQIFVGGVRVDA